MFHVYHNRHFSKSRQFQDFLEVVDDAELRTRDFAKFILTDCEKAKSILQPNRQRTPSKLARP